LLVLFSVWERPGADIPFGKIRTASEACAKLRHGLQVCVPNRQRRYKLLFHNPTHFSE